jgi:hypothetical protein
LLVYIVSIILSKKTSRETKSWILIFNNNYLEVNTMAGIIINNLPNYSISGAELFNDSESFMQELTEDELLETNGGISLILVSAFTVSLVVSGVVSYYYGRTER